MARGSGSAPPRAPIRHCLRHAARPSGTELRHPDPYPCRSRRLRDCDRGRIGSGCPAEIRPGSVRFAGHLPDLPRDRARRVVSFTIGDRVPAAGIGRPLARRHAVAGTNTSPALACMAEPRTAAPTPGLNTLRGQVRLSTPRVPSDFRPSRNPLPRFPGVTPKCDICSCSARRVPP